MSDEVLARLERAETRERSLRRWLGVVGTLSALALFGTLLLLTRAVELAGPPEALAVSKLEIVDRHGVVRVLLSGEVPDAVVNGSTVPRGENAAGVILYDGSGQERSGYLTFEPSGNVALTLDTRERQVALFSADPVDGAAARLWRGNDWVEMRADPAGTGLTVGRAGRLAFQEPRVSSQEEVAFCTEFMTEVAALAAPPPNEVLLEACQTRMPEPVCRRCIANR